MVDVEEKWPKEYADRLVANCQRYKPPPAKHRKRDAANAMRRAFPRQGELTHHRSHGQAHGAAQRAPPNWLTYRDRSGGSDA